MSEIPFKNLLESLLDEETRLHPRYLYRLSDLDPTEIESLEKTWQEIPLWRRQALMEDLEELGQADTILSFEAVARQAIEDDDPKVRSLAIRILNEYETKDLIPKYINILVNDKDADVRAEAALALGYFVYLGELEELPKKIQREIETVLLKTIDNDPAKIVRRRALEAVSFSIHEDVPGIVQKAFDSGDRDWMVSALFSMGRSADRRWNDNVMMMLDHNTPAIRAEAVRAAGELEIKESVLQLLDLLDDTDHNVRSASIWALSQIGGEGVRQSLEWLLEQSEDYDEINLLEAALDNLAFTEDIELYTLFDFPGEDFESSLSEFDILEAEDEFLNTNAHNDDEEFED
jgi:HEAT repeat protein